MPPHRATKKSIAFMRSALSSQLEKIKVKTFGTDINNKEFTSLLVEGIQKSLITFRERPNIFLTERNDFKNVLDDYPDRTKELVQSADKICKHMFDLLGSGEVSLGDSINWHVDFKTGYQWDQKKFYKDIEIPYGKGDIKVPWELSRFQHLILLGQAYQLTRDEEYAIEFRDQVSEWVENNPPKLGVNWACTMDVAIRTGNWLVAWEFFKKSTSIDDNFIEQFLKSILSHGRFIRNNLEYSEELTTNHYLSDIAGLFFIGAMISEFKESEEWLVFSQKELETEIVKQVYHDGCDFEASTCYHRLALELFFYPALLGKRSGIEFSEEYSSCLRKMFEALPYLLKPNGRIPQIGDNDSGRFLKFEPPGSEVLDMRYLLAIGAVFFNEPHLKVFDSDDIKATVCLIYSRDGLEKFNNMKKKEINETRSNAFPDSGWFVMRNKDDHILISCGQNGQNNNGGHGHNDKLSFELCLADEDIIIDPGTYVYTSVPEMRNLFRSTGYHNTIEVEGAEQNRFYYGFLFAMNNDAKAEVLKWKITETEGYFKGRHFGYSRLDRRLIHEREFRFIWHERKIFVTDVLSGNGSILFKLNLHLSPQVSSEIIDNRIIVSTISGQKVLILFQEGEQLEVEDYWYSREYGVKEKAKNIFLKKMINLPFVIEWKMETLDNQL